MGGQKLTAADLCALIRKRYGGQEWACALEVGDGAGFSARRRLDAVAMNLWPSRGNVLIGFEVKISRSDLLRELADEEKAQAFEGLVDLFYLVAPPHIVDARELPDTWGLLVPRGKSLVEMRKPKRLTPSDSGDVDRLFMAGLLKAMKARGELPDDIQAAIQKQGYEEGFAAGKSVGESKVNASEREHERLRDSVAAFERASGVQIHDYDGEHLGRALDQLLKLRRHGRGQLPTRQAELLLSQAADCLETVRELASALEMEAS